MADLVVAAVDLVVAVPLEGGDMDRLSATFLSIAEQQAVTAAVQEAEKQTSGEIVPMVVSASHHYPLAAATGATLISLPLALLLTSTLGTALWLGTQNMYLFLTFFALLYFPARWLVNRFPTLKRLFLSVRDVDEEVEEAAITSFYGEGLYKTREQNGILIFISVLEQKVWILGDCGVNDRIDPGTWQKIIEKLTAGIHSGERGPALCRAVSSVGEILRHHFPIRADDHNELHNIIIK